MRSVISYIALFLISAIFGTALGAGFWFVTKPKPAPEPVIVSDEVPRIFDFEFEEEVPEPPPTPVREPTESVSPPTSETEPEAPIISEPITPTAPVSEPEQETASDSKDCGTDLDCLIEAVGSNQPSSIEFTLSVPHPFTGDQISITKKLDFTDLKYIETMISPTGPTIECTSVDDSKLIEYLNKLKTGIVDSGPIDCSGETGLCVLTEDYEFGYCTYPLILEIPE